MQPFGNMRTKRKRTLLRQYTWRRLAEKLRDMPIKRKLTLAIMVTSAGIALAGGTSALFYEYKRDRSAMVSSLTAQAEIIGVNSAAALESHDAKAAREILAALKLLREMDYACLYTEE